MKRFCAVFALTNCFLYAAEQLPPPPPPEMIEQQLKEAEEEFARAKTMFNPWYTGPLLTPSYHVVPAGLYNLQPYLFVTDNYAAFDKNGRAHDTPDKIQTKFVPVFQFGITPWMNGIVQPQFIWVSQSGHHASRFGDTSVGVLVQLIAETTYGPGLTVSVQESLPSGKYQRLNPKKGGVDGVGSGSYQTTFGLLFGKLVWWEIPQHPMRFRAAFTYQISSRVEVHDFNSYGGGFGTKGKVHPGGNLAVDIGYEYSFTQRWVFATDFIYTFAFKTTFSGRPGVTATGTPAAVGGPFNDQISLAPAIEYNWSENLGVIAGVWFSPWGRNTSEFVSGVFSVNYVW
ncbi:MAG TPA: hypothetical protein VLG76_01115 [Rhabdochlamydiaceae bacterium]|nr:hypothetical protein [Rhabdochlamydiaceae bacterium]